MKKYFLPLLFAISALTIASCNKVVDPEPTPDAEVSGVFILNNGSWGSNNANVGIFDITTKTLSADVFGTVNAKGLGDLGQDILVNGDDVYIAVNGSSLVFVTDKTLKIKKTITAQADGLTLSPRYLCKGNGKIYVSYYEGYLGEINPSNYSVRTTAVGPNPEGVGYANGKIYVANSGGYVPGYNNTVSVVNADSFKEESTITVNTNPAAIKVCGSKIYVSSFGDYGMIPAKVQVIDGGKVSDLDYSSPSAIAMSGETLFVMCAGYDESWNPLPGTIYKHDAKNNVAKGTLSSGVDKAYSLSATDNYVWAGSSDYKNEGDMYVFSIEDGSLVAKFSTGGINPICVAL